MRSHFKPFLFPRNLRINSTTYIELPDTGQSVDQEGHLMYCNMPLLTSIWLTWSGEHGICIISHTQNMAFFYSFLLGTTNIRTGFVIKSIYQISMRNIKHFLIIFSSFRISFCIWWLKLWIDCLEVVLGFVHVLSTIAVIK